MTDLGMLLIRPARRKLAGQGFNQTRGKRLLAAGLILVSGRLDWSPEPPDPADIDQLLAEEDD